MSQQPPYPNMNDPTYTPTQPYTQYPPQFAPPPPKPKRKSRRVLYWIIGICLFIAISAYFGNQNTPQTSTPPATTQVPVTGDTPAATQPPTDTPVPTQPPKWTTVQTFKGNGNKKTGNFDVPDSWRIAWSCTPSSSFGGSYNVIVDVNNSDGTPLDIGAINTICQTGNTADMTEEHIGGTVYLDVTSEGAWVIKIQTLQ